MNGQDPPRILTRSRSRNNPASDNGHNAVPPFDSRVQERDSTRSAPIQPIDVEGFDDDVMICSPTAFAEAKRNSRRNRQRPVVVDDESEERPSRNKHRRGNPASQTTNNDICIILEGSSDSMEESRRDSVPLPPKETTFSCPICLSTLVDEMSTKCGHIFCKECIKRAISAQGKCPTCRKKINGKSIFKIYLPATTE